MDYNEQMAHERMVDEMEDVLPNITYPRLPNVQAVKNWQRAAIAAGYPTCDVCGMPIARSQWRSSITHCPRHTGRQGVRLE